MILYVDSETGSVGNADKLVFITESELTSDMASILNEGGDSDIIALAIYVREQQRLRDY